MQLTNNGTNSTNITRDLLTSEFSELQRRISHGDDMHDVADHLLLFFLNANLDAQSLNEMLTPMCSYLHHDMLVEKGANNFDHIVSGLSPNLVFEQFHKLLSWGIKEELLLDNMYAQNIKEDFSGLVADGGTPAKMIDRLLKKDDEKEFVYSLDRKYLDPAIEVLLSYDLDPDRYVNKLSVETIENHLDELRKAGASRKALKEALAAANDGFVSWSKSMLEDDALLPNTAFV
jgi:hypothetical protein